MEVNRRDALTALAAFASLALAREPQAEAAGPTGQTPAEQPLSQSRVFRFSEMPVSNNPNGGWSRAVLHRPHHHRNSEFILLREGTLEYLNEEKPEPVSPGDVIFTASNRTHGLKNTGSVPALYYVVSISHGQM